MTVTIVRSAPGAADPTSHRSPGVATVEHMCVVDAANRAMRVIGFRLAAWGYDALLADLVGRLNRQVEQSARWQRAVLRQATRAVVVTPPVGVSVLGVKR